MSNRPKARRFWRAVGIAWLIVLLAIFVGDRILNGARGEVYHQNLVSEFRALKPPPNAAVVSVSDNYSRWNSHHALVGATYNAELPYSDILNFYDGELRSRGWTMVSDEPLKDWGSDLGGRAVTYCKGALAASLQFAGTRADYGWTYGLDLTWGLHDCRPRKR